jgi:hypothetical protein
MTMQVSCLLYPTYISSEDDPLAKKLFELGYSLKEGKPYREKEPENIRNWYMSKAIRLYIGLVRRSPENLLQTAVLYLNQRLNQLTPLLLTTLVEYGGEALHRAYPAQTREIIRVTSLELVPKLKAYFDSGEVLKEP